MNCPRCNKPMRIVKKYPIRIDGTEAFYDFDLACLDAGCSNYAWGKKDEAGTPLENEGDLSKCVFTERHTQRAE